MKFHFSFIISILIACCSTTYGQEVNLSENLKVVQLAEHTYLHTGNDNNGIVVIHNGEAILVSTPEKEEETQRLLDWVIDQDLKIVAYIIDRWHPDAMGGINAVHRAGIKTYANELTRRICREKGLTVPQVGFYPELELTAGEVKIIAHYLGAAHTEDGIFVWVPEDRILFGGNSVRSVGGWYGNIGDADLKEWPQTIMKVKECYGDARIVIPGHGKYGGTELLDYTIDMYSPSQWGHILKVNQVPVLPVFNDCGRIFETALADSVAQNKRYLTDAVVFVDHSQKYLKIQSQAIVHDVSSDRISADSGRLQIYSKETDGLIEDLYFKQLYVTVMNNEVEWVIIIKEAIR